MELLPGPDTEWEDPFRIAANWARRNLGIRLLPETVREAETTIIASIANRDKWGNDGENATAVSNRETQTITHSQMEHPATPLPPQVG